MPITATVLMILLFAGLRPLRQVWFVLHMLLVVGTSILIEHWQLLPPLQPMGRASFIWVLCVHLVFINLITFVMYGWDKRQSQHGGWRIPERSLHIHAFLGATPGAYIGSQFFRHKTIKGPFRQQFWLVVLLQLVLLAAIFYFYPR